MPSIRGRNSAGTRSRTLARVDAALYATTTTPMRGIPSQGTTRSDRPPSLTSAAMPRHVSGTRFVVLGLLGRALGGSISGLIAAGVAALDPNLWMNDGLVMSESLAVLLTAGLLLGSYRVAKVGATTGRVALLGVLAALACLVRVE